MCVSVRGVKMYNNICDDIKITKTIKGFKKI